MSRRIRLGESLVEAGLIDTAQLNEALARKTTTGERIGEALVALGYITERDLVRTLAKDADIPFLEADDIRVDPEVIQLVGADTARANNLIPLRADGRALVVVMSNPFDIGVIRALERETGRQIRTATGDPAVIARLVASHYASTGRTANQQTSATATGLNRPAWSAVGASPVGMTVDAAPDDVPRPMRPVIGFDVPEITPGFSAGTVRHSMDRRARRSGSLTGPGRKFSALIDQDSVTVLEYAQEQSGFRLVDTRATIRRFNAPAAAADALADLLDEMRARNAVVSIVMQHFGSFFQSLVLPAADEATTHNLILREVHRSFGSQDPTIEYSTVTPVEGRESGAAAGYGQRHVFVAGAPSAALEAIRSRLAKARLQVELLTVIPEIFRRLYESLDGSTEATAVLVCLQNGPHVAFFVNGQMELAMEPPLAVVGQAPLDTTMILDQLDRGAIFLRQQAGGTVATRLLLSAPAADYDRLGSIIEARTGMRVASLGHGIGSPETVIAMGAVLAAHESDAIDLYPRPKPIAERVKAATSGPSLVVTSLFALAAATVLWSVLQINDLRRARAGLEATQARVEQAMPALQKVQTAARNRERIADIRTAMQASALERSAVAKLLSSVAGASDPDAQLDSVAVTRIDRGFQTTIFGRASGVSAPAAMRAASGLYDRLKSRQELKQVKFQSAINPRLPGGTGAGSGESLRFTISFVAPTGGS
ncbi:MAG: hypothetical protein ABIR92_11030 [Gemmatimonadaceae bacterium]